MTHNKIRPTLLYLAHRFPYPPDKGDRIRTYHLLRYLAKHANIHLLSLADEPVDADALAVLGKLCQRVEAVPLRRTRWLRALGSLATGRTISEGAFDSPALAATLARWSAETRYHAALASASSLAPYLCRAGLREMPAIVDLMDVDSQKWLDYAGTHKGPRAWLYRLEGRRLRSLEKGLGQRFQAVTLVSEAEASIYREFGQPGLAHAVPNGVDLDYFKPAHVPVERACVFVGALNYRPNVEGITWFCREAWPRVRAVRPDLKLWLVGRRPERAVVRLGEIPGVEVVGQVPDVRPYLARAALALVPLRLARGVQNKVLEALAMAKATIASPQSIQGLETKPGQELLAASSASEWVAAIDRLIDDDSEQKRLGLAGREFVLEHHRWETCLAPFAGLLGLSRDQPDGSAAREGETALPGVGACVLARGVAS